MTTGTSSDTATLERLGIFVRDRRHALGLTQTQVAERLGWVQERISLLERGKYGLPSLPALARVATSLDSSLPELLHAAGFLDTPLPQRGESGGADPAGVALIYTIQRILAIEAPSLTEALNEVSDVASEVMGADKVDAFIYDPSIATLVAVGASNTRLGRKQRRIGMDRLALANRGREVEVFETGVPFETGRAQDDPEMLTGITQGLGIRSMLAVPLEFGGKRRGVLAVTSAAEDRFSESDIPFLEAVARWVGSVAHRAEMVSAVTADAADSARRMAVEEFAVVLTHDLGDHLASLSRHIASLQSRARQDGAGDYAVDADSAAISLAGLQAVVTGLLDAVLLDQGKTSLSLDSVDLVTVLHQVVDEVHTDGSSVEFRTPERVVVQADPTRLQEALGALLGNALRHAPDDSPVVVTANSEARDDGHWATITIRDESSGMEPSLLPAHLLRVRAEESNTHSSLALYKARAIAEAHGGSLTVEATSGIGSTFSLSFPMNNGWHDSE